MIEKVGKKYCTRLLLENNPTSLLISVFPHPYILAANHYYIYILAANHQLMNR